MAPSFTEEQRNLIEQLGFSLKLLQLETKRASVDYPQVVKQAR